MHAQLSPCSPSRPAPCHALVRDLHATLDRAICLCTRDCGTCSFFAFEQRLWPLVALLGRLLVRLFLLSRHQRLDLTPWLADGRYRHKEPTPTRRLRTRYGSVSYARAYLIPRGGKRPGIHPLDIVLGLTRDGFSPWLIQFVTRLATRLSYGAAARVCRYALGWAPCTATIEGLVLGLGRLAAPYMVAAPAPEHEGEVLVIEVDGKCTPTATAAELAKRRRRRRAKHKKGCPCGCQRHRGQQRRRARGPKKRRKKGDKSKNGREVVLVALYTLRRGPDGKLHGPINKKVWGSYGGRKAAAAWARAQATKRGFPPGTAKQIEIVIDGAKGLRQPLAKLFPEAWFVLDVRHVEEKLWLAGRAFHAEGSAELAAWVKDLEELLYEGQAAALVQRVEALQEQVPRRGPGTKARRQALARLLKYLKPRLEMLRYRELKARDLVLASGVVEGAARYVVGERLDSAGMRWVVGRAEALLQLRCIELNGDWEAFFAWAQARWAERLQRGKAVQVWTKQPIKLAKVA
jgi:hypothetical protein